MPAFVLAKGLLRQSHNKKHQSKIQFCFLITEFFSWSALPGCLKLKLYPLKLQESTALLLPLNTDVNNQFILIALIARVVARTGYIICFMGQFKDFANFLVIFKLLCPKAWKPWWKEWFPLPVPRSMLQGNAHFALQLVKERMTFMQTNTFDRNGVILLFPVRKA